MLSIGNVVRIGMLSCHIFSCLTCWKFCFTQVTEISRQTHCFPYNVTKLYRNITCNLVIIPRLRVYVTNLPMTNFTNMWASSVQHTKLELEFKLPCLSVMYRPTLVYHLSKLSVIYCLHFNVSVILQGPLTRVDTRSYTTLIQFPIAYAQYTVHG